MTNGQQHRLKPKAMAALVKAGCWPPRGSQPVSLKDREGLADVIRPHLSHVDGPEPIPVAVLLRRLAMDWQSENQDDDRDLSIWRDAIGGWECSPLLADPDGYLRDLARELCTEGHTRLEVWRGLRKQVRRAQEYARRATRDGRLTWPELCERCGKRPPEGRHHKSYHPDQRLDVEWLCHECHADAHRNDDVPKVDLLELAECNPR